MINCQEIQDEIVKCGKEVLHEKLLITNIDKNIIYSHDENVSITVEERQVKSLSSNPILRNTYTVEVVASSGRYEYGYPDVDVVTLLTTENEREAIVEFIATVAKYQAIQKVQNMSVI